MSAAPDRGVGTPPPAWGVCEPATLGTDYLLGAVSAALAVRLFQQAGATGQRAIVLWGGALIAMALGAFAGGTYHGFAPRLPRRWERWLWWVTVAVAGFSSFFFALAIAAAQFGTIARWLIAVIAAVKLAGYLAWTWRHDSFQYVIRDHVPAMLFVLVMQLAAWGQGAPSGPWMVAGALTAFAGGAIQAARLAPHPSFNHNDLFHVVQIAAVWLLYRGGMLLQDF
jgi:hypothetical protein